MSNPVIQTDIAEILKEIRSDQKKLLEGVNGLKLGQAEIKGEIKALDTKVEQLDKRIGNSELTNRGYFGWCCQVFWSGRQFLIM